MYIQPRYRGIRIHIEKVGFKMIFSSFLPSKLMEIAIFLPFGAFFAHFSTLKVSWSLKAPICDNFWALALTSLSSNCGFEGARSRSEVCSDILTPARTFDVRFRSTGFLHKNFPVFQMHKRKYVCAEI